MIASIPPDEIARLADLRQYAVLDTLPEQAYDDITALAADICDVPISLISLVDSERQWFKSNHGMGTATETSRDLAFCAHNILNAETNLEVEDARLDPRFVDNDLVTGDPNIVFYAGIPLVTEAGHALGSLCVIDREPRQLSPEQRSSLQALSRQVMSLLRLRRVVRDRDAQIERLHATYRDLDDFSGIISHELKAPLRSIEKYLTLVREEFGDQLTAEAHQMLETTGNLALEARDMVRGLLKYSKAVYHREDSLQLIDLKALVEAVSLRFNSAKPGSVTFLGPIDKIYSYYLPLRQILQNLIGNSLKFGGNDVRVEVSCEQRENSYLFLVVDNGPGIPANKQASVFTMFFTNAEEAGKEGHGVGLNIVQRLVSDLGGTVAVHSAAGKGTTISFSVML